MDDSFEYRGLKSSDVKKLLEVCWRGMEPQIKSVVWQQTLNHWMLERDTVYTQK